MMLNGHEGASYVERLEAFRRSDAERDAFVTELVQKYEGLQAKYQEKCDDYDNEVESRRTWQTQARNCDRELVAMRQTSGSNPFVMVLLDGDGAIFHEHLYSHGKEGGADAAFQLQEGIKTQLKDKYPDANVSQWNIVVNVVLNLQGLGNKLQACGIIHNPNELQAFGRAFGLAQPLFNFIDVGNGKERADHKIRETLRLFLPIPQCKHIFFGPCHDNGYLPVLEPYKRDSAISSRITLIETTPSQPGFNELGFSSTRFPNLFRNTNLSSGRSSMPTLASPSTAPSIPPRTSSTMQVNASPFVPQFAAPSASQAALKSVSPAPSADSAASNTWATVGKGGPTGKNIDIAPKKTVPKRNCYVNVDDERLDAPLPHTDPGAEKRFATRVKEQGKCCNDYHLSGNCQSGEFCDYTHGERLSPGEMLVLKHKARSRTCPQKYTCRNVDCTFGHHCKYGKGCIADNCWFADTHYMDLEPAKKVYDDGSEDWIQAYLNKIRK